MSSSAHPYRLTTICCFVGIFVQAIVSNLTAILFLPMMNLYGFTYIHLGILVGVNFATQVAADIVLSGAIDKRGFRFFVLPTCLLSFAGLLLFAATPLLFPGHVFAGILAATVIFAFSSGMLEVILSPIIDAIPGDDKGPAMSLMHSFYAWGQAATIIVTTLFIFLFGGARWPIVVLLWAIVPLTAFFLFLRAPFPPNKPAEHRQGMRALLLRPFYLIALAAIFCGAAAEVVLNQWSSTYMEKGLGMPKVAGDLLGMCGYAVMLGLGRVIYGLRGSRLNMNRVLMGGSLLALVCYLIVSFSPFSALNIVACALCGFGTSLLWPGTLVLSSEHYPMAGAWLFAVLAAAGDIGAAFGSWLAGAVADGASGSPLSQSLASLLRIDGSQADLRIAILVCAVFPLLAFLCHLGLTKLRSSPR